MQTINPYFIEFKKDIQRYRWLLIGCLVVAFLLSSVTVYGFTYNGYQGIFSIGTSSPGGLFTVGTGVNSLYIIGPFSSLPQNAQSAYPLFILLPIEIVALIFLVLILRIQNSGSVKAIAITCAMAIILIVSYLIMTTMLHTLGLG
jgi:hypothetical protein